MKSSSYQLQLEWSDGQGGLGGPGGPVGPGGQDYQTR